MKRGTTDLHKEELIHELRKSKKQAWIRVASRLQRPRRRARGVNLWKINKHTKEGDTIVVPGKVLGVGELDHKVTVGAMSYSENAVQKLKSNALSIIEVFKKNPSGSKLIILE